MWNDTYVGLVDRPDPNGKRWPGCLAIEDVIARLIEADGELQDPDAPLLAWGLDPIYFPGERLSVKHLDRVSTTRPIHITHSSGHSSSVNSVALDIFEIDSGTNVIGVVKDEQGNPTGELQEMVAIALVAPLTEGRGVMYTNPAALRAFAQDGVNTGTTTLTDLGSQLLMDDDGVDLYRAAVDENFPARLNVFHFGLGLGKVALSFEDAAQRMVQLAQTSQATNCDSAT